MDWLFIILLLLAGVLALSTFIVAKKPDAKAMIDKLVPFQAFIGVGLLGISLWYWLHIGIVNIFRLFSFWAMLGLGAIGGVFSGILLGALFGMPQIAKWIPGDSPAEQKALDLSKKVAPIQMIVGIVALGSGLILLLINLHILKP